jgi:hypothetical protein
LAAYLHGVEVHLVAKSVDGRTYMLLAHLGTPRIHGVITGIANWFGQQLERRGSTLEVVDGPVSELSLWQGV